MSSTDRQSRLLITEDWKTIYQSFRNADFQSYDFDNLRRTMINYIRQNYPEDFNDYIESSEYLALIDLIAFLGQNLSFRVDLNARENFLETAERRESVLRLARLISYNPKRNKSANGLLKVETVSTSETVFDSNGQNLAGATVRWNDQSNSNYFEQFVKIMNASLPVNNTIGRPLTNELIENVSTEQYRVNGVSTELPVYDFSRSVEGVTTRFEVVSTAISNGQIVEEPPLPGNSPSFLYRDDGQGAGSSNTGFFMHFRQGELQNGQFQNTNPIPNQVVNIDTPNINNTDVWLYSLDSNGFENTLWTKVDSVEGNNIIYNSIFNNVRNIYAVTTRIEDRINLVFSDGVFGSLPAGNFKVYFRTTDNRNSVISPNSLSNIQIEIPYISRNNVRQILTLGLSLKYTVSNSSTSETNEEIKSNAPATYYTQNRLITGEDYNIGPLGISQDIIKTKSVNRFSSGISKYYDLKDPTGKYSNTSLFADDGVIYREEYTEKSKFSFATQTDIEGIIYNLVEPIVSSKNMRNFYYQKYNNILVDDLNATWEVETAATNRYTGRLKNPSGNYLPVSGFTANNLRFLEKNSLVKFVPPETDQGETQYFLPDGTFTTQGNQKNAVPYRWVKIINVYSDGTELDLDGFGPIIINDNIPQGSVISEIIPILSRSINNDLKVQIIDRAFIYKDFALRYDREEKEWKLIEAENINTIRDFSLGKAGDTTGTNQDSSWLLYFKTDGEKYIVTYRSTRYVFESDDEIRFFFDKADKIYNPKTGEILKDRITVLKINNKPDSLVPFTIDFDWSITNSYKDKDGYVDTKKIEIDFFDSDDDGVVDNPELFENIVQESQVQNNYQKYIFQEKYTTTDGVEDFKYFDNSDRIIVIVESENDTVYKNRNLLPDGQIFYIISENIFKRNNISLNNVTTVTDYRAFPGRDNLKFHYFHVADSEFRIDPASSNIIDTYLLTNSYDVEYRKYLRGGRPTKPLPPSSDELFRSYGSQINKIKSISDEVIYHPVKYKPLFGREANQDLQVTFKIVKNKELTVNNNKLRANVINAVNRFFSVEFWNFGDTFYFQELSAYIMNTLTPELVSVVIVPRRVDKAFGSLFEIKSEVDEIFINAAEVSDVEIIDEITASNLQAEGAVVTSTQSVNTGIQSSSSGSYNT